MLKQQNAQADCLNFVFTGNCIEPRTCGRRHPDLKLQTKKKLVFSTQKEFVPDQSIFSTLGQTPVPIYTQAPPLLREIQQPPVCDCCKGFPMSCKTTEICVKMGKCFCAAQEALEVLIKQQEAPSKETCSCCKGDIYNCAEVLCQQLGMCQCQMRRDIEEGGPDDEDYADMAGEYFLPEYSDCQCCGGYVLTCGGPECYNGCFCLL